MSRVTVKHYLEKRVNPIDISDIDKDFINKELFPIYVQLTFKRKTFKFKSYSGIIMTEKGFDEFIKNGVFIDKEVSDFFGLREKPYIPINKEVELIEKSIRYSNEKLKGNYSIKDIIEGLITPLDRIIIDTAWIVYQSNFAEPKYKEYWKFLSALNPKYSPYKSLNVIDTHTGSNLSSFLKDEYKITWDCVDILLDLFSNLTFIEVVSSDYKSKIKTVIEKFPVSKQIRIINEAEMLINLYVENLDL